MLTQLQIQNFESSFDALDYNHDDTIDEMDLAGRAKSTCDDLGLAAGTPKRAAMMSSYSHLWEQLRRSADTDDDGRVSRAEYMDAAASTLIQSSAYIKAVSMVADASFDAVDTDDDGSVSLDEVTRLYMSVVHDASAAAAGFTQVDTDGDGQISRDEWRAAIVGMYLSDNPEGMGSNMMGHVK